MLKMGFVDVRFRPAYFPYTEPSVEPEVYIEGMGWIELGGRGVPKRGHRTSGSQTSGTGMGTGRQQAGNVKAGVEGFAGDVPVGY